MLRYIPAFLLLTILLPHSMAGQGIKGEVADINDMHPLGNVQIVNVYNSLTVTTGKDGTFYIPAAKGEVLEFRLIGYKTAIVRIPQGIVPPYFKILMKQGSIELPEYTLGTERKYNYHDDSLRFHELYKHELDVPKMSTLDIIEHPFSALSKRSQEIWNFQNDYKYNEEQKYIDYTFNEKLIKNLTGLSGDSAQMYIKRYRPTYDQLRSMSEYSLYSYIRRTVGIFRIYGGYSPGRNQQ